MNERLKRLDGDPAQGFRLERVLADRCAGIENELFYNPKTSMLFGDAKQSLLKVIAEIKQL